MAERSNKRLAAVEEFTFREFIRLIGAKDSNEGIIVATANRRGKVQLAAERRKSLSHFALLIKTCARFGGFALFGGGMEVSVSGAGIAVAGGGQDHHCQAECQSEASGFGKGKTLRVCRHGGGKLFLG